MLKSAIFAILTAPSILAALTRKEMASALIATNDTEALEKTFKKYEKEQDEYELAEALADVAEDEAHMPKVATCLRVALDPLPEDKMRVNYLAHRTFLGTIRCY